MLGHPVHACITQVTLPALITYSHKITTQTGKIIINNKRGTTASDTAAITDTAVLLSIATVHGNRCARRLQSSADTL